MVEIPLVDFINNQGNHQGWLNQVSQWIVIQMWLTELTNYVIVRHHIPASSRYKCWVGGVKMMQHRNQGGAEVSMHHFNTSYEAFMPWRGWLWCLIGLENGKQVVKRTGVVGHKSLSTKRLVVESLSDIKTSIFKALLTYHFFLMGLKSSL